MLLGAAALWGTGFVAQRAAMEHMGPFLFNTLRYLIGAAILLPAGHLVLRRLGVRWDRRVLRDGVVLGSVLALGAGLQQAGMVTTTASRAGFITGLYVLMVPAFALCFGHRPTRGNVAGVALAFLGMLMFVDWEGGGVTVGDWLVLGSAVAWALHVVLIGTMAPRRDPTALVGVQFAAAGLLSGAVVLAFERTGAVGWWGAALPVAYSGLFATAAAFTLQFMAQRDAPPTHATILLSTEALFAAVFGWMLLSEKLGLMEIVGGSLMFSGALVSQRSSRPGVVSGTGSDPTPPP
jgi:drug/metabolite transporter (DMT)-like permease